MDLTIPLKGTTLNVRVAALMQTPRGYLFEKNKAGYLFVVGGRVKLGESSHEAMVREITEEVGVRVENLTLRALIENFFESEGRGGKVQEICYVYATEDPYKGPIPPDLVEVPLNELDQHDVRPSVIKDILKDADSVFRHVTVRGV